MKRLSLLLKSDEYISILIWELVVISKTTNKIKLRGFLYYYLQNVRRSWLSALSQHRNAHHNKNQYVPRILCNYAPNLEHSYNFYKLLSDRLL